MDWDDGSDVQLVQCLGDVDHSRTEQGQAGRP